MVLATPAVAANGNVQTLAIRAGLSNLVSGAWMIRLPTQLAKVIRQIA